MNIVLKVTVLLIVLSLCEARLKCKPTKNHCGKNAEFREQCGCGDLSCAHPKPPKICPLFCREGCFCKKGYIRDANNNCIRPEKCPELCPGAHDHYEKCGTACPDTCDNIGDGYNETSRPCTKNCVAGCFCDKGFRRDDSGKCIKTEDCPCQECGDHEHYTDCGTACPDTCDNYKGPNRPCITLCVAGCFCDEGYVRNDSGKCVKPDECPCHECGDNEHYTDCGTACPDTCDNYKDTDRMCTEQCVAGCFCDEGYVRNDSGKCIEPDECPCDVCGDHEELVDLL